MQHHVHVVLLVVRKPKDPTVTVGGAAGVGRLELVGERHSRASSCSDRCSPRAQDTAADHEHVVGGKHATESALHYGVRRQGAVMAPCWKLLNGVKTADLIKGLL